MTTIQSSWSHVVTPGYVETAELERGGGVALGQSIPI